MAPNGLDPAPYHPVKKLVPNNASKRTVRAGFIGTSRTIVSSPYRSTYQGGATGYRNHVIKPRTFTTRKDHTTARADHSLREGVDSELVSKWIRRVKYAAISMKTPINVR